LAKQGEWCTIGIGPSHAARFGRNACRLYW
jgi:hypothetical protein